MEKKDAPNEQLFCLLHVGEVRAQVYQQHLGVNDR